MKTLFSSVILLLVALNAFAQAEATPQAAEKTDAAAGSASSVGAAEEPARVFEVEDYLNKRIQEYLTVRFPNRPFTVLVRVTPDRAAPAKEQEGEKLESVTLPYLEVDSQNLTIDDWVRKDVPVEDLLSKVKKIEITLNLPSELTEQEVELIRMDLGLKLRLNSERDVVTVSKRQWSTVADAKKDSANDRGPASVFMGGSDEKKIYGLSVPLALSIVMVLFGLIWLWFVSQSSIKKLVKGMGSAFSDLWSKIEKGGIAGAGGGGGGSGAQAMESAIVQALEATRSAGGQAASHGSATESVDVRHAIRELLPAMKDIFASPQVDLMEILEEEGTRAPGVVGGLLLELDNAVVQEVFAYGQGEWWFNALLHPEPLSARSLSILEKIGGLRHRRAYDPASSLTGDARVVSLLLWRLNEAELGDMFAAFPFEHALPALKIMRASKAISVAKLNYPDRWSQVLNAPVSATVPDKVAKAIQARAVQARPLRNGEQVRGFFKDLELLRYLDVAGPADERDIYQVLATDSTIVRNRRPFYTVLGLSSRELSIFAGIVTNQDWAVALSGTSPDELNAFLGQFSERQRYFVSEAIEGLRARGGANADQIRNSRRKIMAQMALLQQGEAVGQQAQSAA